MAAPTPRRCSCGALHSCDRARCFYPTEPYEPPAVTQHGSRARAQGVIAGIKEWLGWLKGYC